MSSPSEPRIPAPLGRGVVKWIETEPITVPAHANTTTEVAVNEWFIENHSFLLGTPVANQLRGTAGGWVQTMAVAPEPGQDTIALLRDRLSQILEKAKGDATTPPLPEDTETIQTQGDCNIMATVIPADKFESNSPYAFILRENPKASGIEIHFPPDATPDPGFIGRIASAGFQQAHSNPSLWYHKQYSDDLMAKARGWVKSCQRFGAYEISSSEPVEQTKSRRRGKPNGNKANSSPTPEPAPATGNKLVDAVCDRVQQMLDSLKQELVVKPDASELDALRAENEQLKAQIETLTSERDAAEKVVASQREAITVAVAEVERLTGEVEERDRTIADIRQQLARAISAGKEMVDCRDRTIAQLRQQLMEWGVEEESAPVFEDEPVTDAPDFDEEVPVFEDEPVTDAPDFDEEVQDLGEFASGSESSSEPDDIEGSEASEPEGFDLDSLGE